MERFNYIACDASLEELKNPYITYYSVKEALDKGLEVEPESVKGLISVRAKKTVAYCEDETKLGYPTVYEIKKRQYRLIVKSRKKKVYKLETDLTPEYMGIVIEYLNKCLESAKEIELCSVLIDDEKESKEASLKISELSPEALAAFLTEDVSENKITLTK